jgi:hypothetical protein
MQDDLPDREGIEWAITPCRLTFQERTAPGDDGEPIVYYLIVMDTGDNRNVTAWTRDELEAVLRKGLAVIGAIPDGIMLAGPDDLRGGTVA